MATTDVIGSKGASESCDKNCLRPMGVMVGDPPPRVPFGWFPRPGVGERVGDVVDAAAAAAVTSGIIVAVAVAVAVVVVVVLWDLPFQKC